MKKHLLALGVAMALVTSVAAAAQAAPPSAAALPVPLDAEAQRSVVETMATALVDNYVYPDIGSRAAALIRANVKAGRYEGLDKAAFAHRLTEDLRSVAHDLHMRVTVEGAPPVQASDPGQAASPQGMFSFERADLLEGNIGYVRIDGFLPPELFRLGADPVMEKLAGTDALIIDMRYNHGGDPAAVSYLVSFFVDPATPVHVNDLIWRKPGTLEYNREVFSTGPTPVAYLNKPVVVLTGKRTFSGGEEFSYDMQQLKRARLVGETTGGGANPGGDWPVGSGLVIFIPTGRAENPITGTSWEGTGVKPDMPATENAAFAKGYALALEATRKSGKTADTPDAVLQKRLMVRRTDAYPNGAGMVRASVEGLARGEQPFHLFSPGLAEALKGPVPPALQKMVAELGPIEGITFMGVDALGGDEYEVRFAKGRQIWSIIVNGDKIVWSNFRAG